MRLRLLAAIGAATAFSGVAASAAVLVVRSAGPSARAYPPGKALPDDQMLNLKANDIVVLLDSRGTRTLRGPGAFGASASSVSRSGSALGAIVAENKGRRVRIGAVRGGGSSRNVWQADIARSGNVCVGNPADLGLYRSIGANEAMVTVSDIASGAKATARFASGQQIAEWPSAVPVSSGKRYRLSGEGGATTLTVRSIAPVPAGLEGLAQSLIRNDCQAQLDVLIDTFAAPSAS